MKAKIGDFIPQFPAGQTHIFLWRERQFLAELGIETGLVSTQPPPKAISLLTYGQKKLKKILFIYFPLLRKILLTHS